MIGVPSIFKLTRIVAALPRLLSTFALICVRKAARFEVVYYESLKRELKTKTTYGYRCDERLKTNVKESTHLACTPLCAELEHLKIETRLNWVVRVNIQ